MVSKEAIQEFKKIYQKVFKEALDDTEASRRANNLLEFYKAVYLPADAENLTTNQNTESA